MKITLRTTNREEWLAHRQMGIGSSEVATILGLNPYDTPYQLWRRKKGFDEGKEENFAMRAGHYLEDAVSKFWMDETGHQIIKSSAGDWLVFDNAAPHRKVSPDRTFWLTGKAHNDKNKGILECKTTQMRVDAEDPPKHWFCQLQYQMGVMGVSHGALAWLVAGREFGHREFTFNPAFFAWICEEVDKFWEHNILMGNEPELVNPSDILAKFTKHTEGKSVEASAEVCEAVYQLKVMKDQKKKLEEDIVNAENVVKMAMQDAELLTLGGSTIATWRTSKASTKVDTKGLLEDMGTQPIFAELIGAHTVEVPGTRRFNLK